MWHQLNCTTAFPLLFFVIFFRFFVTMKPIRLFNNGNTREKQHLKESKWWTWTTAENLKTNIRINTIISFGWTEDWTKILSEIGFSMDHERRDELTPKSLFLYILLSFFFIQSLFRQNMIIFINRFRFMNNNRLKSSFSFLLHSKSVYLNYMKTKQMIYDAAFLNVGFSYLSFACFWRIDRYRRHCIICIAWYYMEKQQSGRNSQDALTKLERRCKQNFFVFFQRI